MLSDTTDFCRLFLLRHPELEPASAHRVVGRSDAGLGRRGQEQVLRWLSLFTDLPLSAVYCADQVQCVEPARALANHKQVDLIPDKRLDDQDMGSWQGRTWDEVVEREGAAVRDFFANFGEVKAPEGESLGESLERMLEWWREVAPGGLQKSYAVVVSGAMLSGFATAMLGMRLSRSVSLHLPHAGLGILDCYANGARIETWNPTALAPEA